jgi:hypothetical protein
MIDDEIRAHVSGGRIPTNTPTSLAKGFRDDPLEFGAGMNAMILDSHVLSSLPNMSMGITMATLIHMAMVVGGRPHVKLTGFRGGAKVK